MMRRSGACRACGGTDLSIVLELGAMPLANALIAAEDLPGPEPRFPLTLAFCPACSLLQILETVDPEVLFRHYLYFSSFSDAMLAHAAELAATLAAREALGPDSLVVEIASNDGYLLRNFVARGVPVLGIEPARNVAEVARERGVETLTEFFGADLARRLAAAGRRADLVIANNVLAHVDDLHGVAEGIATILQPRGLAALEFPWAGAMIERLEFDTIYHEHLCYFSLHAVRRVFERRGLAVEHVAHQEIHGGSLRVLLRHAAAARPDESVETLLAEERRRGMTALPYYADFARRVRALGAALTAELTRRKARGERLAAYGASAKGATLMNAFGIGGDLLDFVADRSTVKQGRYTPGHRLAIVPAEALVERRPDAVLLLTWNFADEIFRQQRAYLEAGGVFIVPIPEVRVVGKEVLG